ncbi:MAG TPA: glycine betaine ABC transporter substrate-binding protein [Solirubrobacterales bacterium]|nr:glycine betaine ABC transporter substrate-binding protein [Solirubrobacterales bacterium]
MALALAASLAACGGSSGPPITIGAGDTAEETILGQIYTQALERVGFDVEPTIRLPAGPKSAEEALERGRISAYPEHLSTPTGLTWGSGAAAPPADPQKAYRQAVTRLGKRGMTAFPPTPFSFTNLVGALRPLADRRKLKRVSDLQGQSEELTIVGPFGCHEAINCVEGLERLYGLGFGGFIYKVSDPDTEPFEALESKFSDLAMVPSTDGRLFADRSKFATLEEDRRLFPAGNAILVTTEELVEAAGPDLEATIVAAQKGLTLAVMQELDARVEIDGRNPAAVAAGYLDRIGFDG